MNPQDLEKIAGLTLDHYNRRAEEFWQGTRDHDVSQNISALLRFIAAEPPCAILDFGCGPGRDLKVFASLGHVAIGQPVPIEVDSFRDATFQGVVQHINSVGEYSPRNLQTADERADQVFATRIGIREGQDQLRAGMAAFTQVPK